MLSPSNCLYLEGANFTTAAAEADPTTRIIDFGEAIKKPVRPFAHPPTKETSRQRPPYFSLIKLASNRYLKSACLAKYFNFV